MNIHQQLNLVDGGSHGEAMGHPSPDLHRNTNSRHGGVEFFIQLGLQILMVS